MLLKRRKITSHYHTPTLSPPCAALVGRLIWRGVLRGLSGYPKHLPSHVSNQEHKHLHMPELRQAAAWKHCQGYILDILRVFYNAILNQVIQPETSDWHTDLRFYSLLFPNSNGLAPIATQNWLTVCVCGWWTARSKQHKQACLRCQLTSNSS